MLGVSDLEEHSLANFLIRVSGQSEGVIVADCKGSTVDGNIVEFAEFIVRLDLHGVCVVNEPETFDLSNAVDCTLEDLVNMDFQDNNIVFALNIIKFDSPGVAPVLPSTEMISSSTYSPSLLNSSQTFSPSTSTCLASRV